MLDSSARRLTWTGYWALTLIGVYIAALGPGLPSIAARTGVPLAQAGTLFTAIFTGGLVTSIGAGRAMDRFGRRPLLIAGSLANGLGAFGLSLATTWPQALAAAFLLGVGDTIIVIGYHVLFADLYKDASGAALSRLNVFFGLGALSGPALAGASLLAAGDIRFALWLVAAGQSLAALLVLLGELPPVPVAPAGAELGLRQLVQRPLLWLLAALIFLYVGLEVGLGNWTYTYLRRGGVGVGIASLLSSGFWLALMLGRLCSPALLRRVTEPVLLLVATAAVLFLSSVLVSVAGWRPAGALLILLVGFGFGPIWPLVFSIATRMFHGGAGAASGLLGTAGSISGLIGPWLQGVLLLHVGAQAGMALTLAGCAGMLVLAAATRTRLLRLTDDPVPAQPFGPATGTN